MGIWIRRIVAMLMAGIGIYNLATVVHQNGAAPATARDVFNAALYVGGLVMIYTDNRIAS